MDKLIKEVFDRHQINFKSGYNYYVDDSYDDIKEAIEEITRIRVAEALIDYHRSTMKQQNLFPSGNFE